VLLADDNADMRDYAARLLREQGWEVEAVADGLAALEAARRWRPDLVLSDVMMPGLDGFSLLRALRADPSTSTTPVILLSARAGEEARVEGAHAGADDYLVKPFSAQELVARVGAHLSLARERARATAAVETARDLLTRVLEQAPVAICMTRGPEHRFELANPFYQRLLPRREIIGRRAIDVIPELQAQGLVSVLDEVFTSGCAWSGSGVPLAYDRHGDGVQETAYFNAYYHPFADADGKTVGVIAVCLDVTDQVLARRDAEAARSDAETARQVAEAANRAKSQFLAVMSHELRTPLNAIAGHVQLMDMEIHGPITAPQRDALARVERSQRHLLRLINDVLNLSRIETGRVDYQIEDVTIQHVAADLAPMIEPQLAGKELLYEVRLPEEPLIVHADREKVGQVLLNLLSNAVKFTPPGGRVTLDATTRESVPDTVFVRVTDTGVGVPPEKQSVIFEPFVQVQTGPTRATDGAGLGLAISRDLARGMGGDLRVRSIEGVGATFTLSLPTR
jgi:DNA-binding response OmpR family regulator/nitrogen-specific signal transduction histidine kinase